MPEPKESAAGLLATIQGFIETARLPAILEPGEQTFPLKPDNHAISTVGTRVQIHVWDETRNLVRRAVHAKPLKPGLLEVKVERWGQPPSRIVLTDLARVQSIPRERTMVRQVFQEQFRRMLGREFPGWQVERVSSGQYLECSLSAVFPRALLRLGSTGWAAIGAPETGNPDGALTYGLIWLDYLRRQEQRLTMQGLVVLAPEDRHHSLALRMRHLDTQTAQFGLYLYTSEGACWQANLADTGNLETVLNRPGQLAAPPPPRGSHPELHLEAAVRADLRALHPALEPSPVYGQVLAL